MATKKSISPWSILGWFIVGSVGLSFLRPRQSVVVNRVEGPPQI